MSADLAVLIRSYLNERTVLDPADLERERRTNTVWFGIPDGFVDPEVVSQALVDVGDGLRARHRRGDGPVTFYAWCDEQAGQLRCSMVSGRPDALPFRGPFEAVLDSSRVVALLVNDPRPGVVRDLASVADVDIPVDHRFPVFVSIIRP